LVYAKPLFLRIDAGCEGCDKRKQLLGDVKELIPNLVGQWLYPKLS